jgi:uncharacterized protein
LSRRGSGPKPSRIRDEFEVQYSAHQWNLFRSQRRRALSIFEGLGEWRMSGIVHGSLARGDVDEKSDIDILIPLTVSTQLVEADLEKSGFEVVSKEIVQPTPTHSPKAHLFLDLGQGTCVTVPLSPFRTLEEEFYKFGGAVSWKELVGDDRTKGCTKKLTLIEPTESGHLESPVIGRESEVSRILGISTSIVKERVRVLSRRDAIGRTGVFLKLDVPEGFSCEEMLERESMGNPALRRTLRKRHSSGKR